MANEGGTAVLAGQRRRGPSGLVYIVDWADPAEGRAIIWFEGTDYRLTEYVPLAALARDELLPGVCS